MADPQHPLMPYLRSHAGWGDLTLARMKRRYNLAEMDAFFARAVREVPNLCVGTDMMVGFWVKRHFEQTCKNFHRWSIYLLSCIYLF